MVEETRVDIDQDAKSKSSTGMEPKIAVLIAYIFSLLGGLIIYFIEKENKFVKWHAMQAIILGIIQVGSFIVISVLLGMIPFIGWFFFSWLGWVISVVAWVFGIIALVQAFNGKTYRVPWVANMADKYAKL
jgi:uncharacterized membrane protein